MLFVVFLIGESSFIETLNRKYSTSASIPIMSGWKSYGKNNLSDEEVDTSDKIAEVQMEIDASKHSVSQAIDKTVARGDKLEDLDQKAENMRDHAELFNKNARKARWEFLKQNIKIKILCGVAILVVFFIIFFAAIYPAIKDD